MHGRTRELPPGTGCTLDRKRSLRCKQQTKAPALAAPPPRLPGGTHSRRLRTPLTLVWAETPLLVSVEARGGSAPEAPISAALAGTGGVLLAQEDKGEDAQLACRVAPNHSSVGWKEQE